MSFRVASFGRDCLGNITGYAVLSEHDHSGIAIMVFVGDIYVADSFEDAYMRAQQSATLLNSLEVVS